MDRVPIVERMDRGGRERVKALKVAAVGRR